MMRVPLPAILVVVAFLVIPSMAMADSPYVDELYESYNMIDGGSLDGFSNVHGRVWDAQMFAATSAHNVSRVTLPLGIQSDSGSSPGTAVLEIRDSTRRLSLGSSSINMSSVSNSTDIAWYSFNFSPAISLEQGTTYSLVLHRGSTDDVDDAVRWYMDTTAPGYVGYSRYWSITSGQVWSEDAASDHLFEIWGNDDLLIQDAAVFQGFASAGIQDWLIAVHYTNTVEPGFPSGTPDKLWYIQLLDPDSNILAQSSIRMWGSRPGSIYLNANAASAMDWGNTSYQVRLYGNFGDNPSTVLTLNNNPGDSTGNHWIGNIGSSGNDLRAWCIHKARVMGEDDNDNETEYITQSEGIFRLNTEGGTIFEQGIPGLVARLGGDLFLSFEETNLPDETDFNQALQTSLDWETELGTDISATLTDLGTPLSLDGKTMGFIGIMLLYVVVVVVAVPTGHTAAGLIGGSGLLLWGMSLGVVDVVWIGIAALVMVAMFGWHMVLRNT